MDIAAIGLAHLSDALSGKMSRATVDEWADADGKKCVVYWRPLTGAEQQKIDAFTGNVEKICATIKYRARDADGRLIFAATPMASLVNDYDFQVLQALAFLMVSGLNQDSDDKIEAFEKE